MPDEQASGIIAPNYMTKEHQGRSVEEMGKLWARRQVESIRGGEKDAVLIVEDTKEYKRRMNLPSLGGERTASGVFYDFRGHIYTSRWDPKKTETDEVGRRRLVNPEEKEFRILSPSRLPRRDYLNRLPIDKPVAELKFLQTDSIEKAIRLQRHVLEEFSPEMEGDEIKLAQAVVEYSDKLARRYLTGTVTEEKLDSLANETGNFLEDIGMIRPEDPDKKKLFDMLTTVNTKDSRGRINPLVSRVKARAAYIAAMRRIAKGSLVVEKFDANLQILLYEREITRWALETAISYDQMGFHLLSHSFLKRGSGGTEFQKRTLVDVLNTIVEGYLSVPRVRPYVNIARLSSISLVGARREGWMRDMDLFGYQVADILHRGESVSELIMEGDYEEARLRLKRVINEIGEVLEENEEIG